MDKFNFFISTLFIVGLAVIENSWADSCSPFELVGQSGNKYFYKDENETVTGKFRRNFAQYVQFCHENGMQLATIMSQTEHQVVIDWINRNYYDKYMWLGGWDINNEGTYIWLQTGQVMSYTHWGNFQPTGNREQNCIALGFYQNGGLFFDENCTVGQIALCQSTANCKQA